MPDPTLRVVRQRIVHLYRESMQPVADELAVARDEMEDMERKMRRMQASIRKLEKETRDLKSASESASNVTRLGLPVLKKA